MIGWKTQKDEQDDVVKLQSFDDFELRLGDIMRGERATMGKSLLDVQRELRIKAAYIAAIENCDPDVFETPGFIAGYVRSYARYLNLNPEDVFAAFCAESGFSTAHGMSEKASSRKGEAAIKAKLPEKSGDPFVDPKLPFAPKGDGFFASVEPGAIGSSLVLLALIVGIGYGGWSVLQEVQRVNVTPVEQTPIVLSDLDPVSVATPVAPTTEELAVNTPATGVFTPPSGDVMDRLYRPQALDVPVLVARDAPISTLDPRSVGAFASASMAADLPMVDMASAQPLSNPLGTDGVTLVAARAAWVRVRDGAGSVIFEQVMAAGDTWSVPQTVTDPTLSVGESGAVYFAMQGRTFGPVGPSGSVTTDLPLEQDILAAAYRPADLTRDQDLQRVVADLSDGNQATTVQPKVVGDSQQGVMLVAVRPAWVRVRSADGSVIYEGIMAAGDTWTAPATETAPTLRVGESGAIYFAVNGQAYGPAGPRGKVTSNLALSADALTDAYQIADVATDGDLQRILANLDVSVLGQNAE